MENNENISLNILVLMYLLVFSSISNAEEVTVSKSWIKPIQESWTVTPLLNVGDSVGKVGYRMVGVPDGLGAMNNGDGTLSVFMNHELASDMGKLRAHASRGAFVSRWMLNMLH